MFRALEKVYPFVALLFLAVTFCVMCGKNLGDATSGDHYWVRACVTTNEKLLVAGGDEAAAVDLATGKVVATAPMNVAAVACGASSGLAYGLADTLVRFPGAQQEPTHERDLNDVLGARPDGALVRFSRRTDQKASPTEWARVRVGSEPDLALDPTRFGGAIAGVHDKPMSAFFTRVGALLPDGRLLLAAGWEPNRGPGSLEPVPWGVYALDASSGAVTPVAAPLRCSTDLDTARVWRVATTSDFQRSAVAFRTDGGRTRVAVYDGARLRFTTDLPDAREVTALDFTADGEQLTVATLADDGARARVSCIDGTGGVAWTSAEVEDTIALLHHLADGSLVVMTSKRVVLRLGADGTVRPPP
jgi:hypothetical protein